MGGIAGIVGGAVLMLDDYKDLGKTDRPWHHEYIGAGVLGAGVITLGWTVFAITAEVNPQFKPTAQQARGMMNYSKELLEMWK